MTLPTDPSSSNIRQPAGRLDVVAPVQKVASRQPPTKTAADSLDPRFVFDRSVEPVAESVIAIDMDAIEPAEITVSDRIVRNGESISSVLVSTIFHTIIFLILGLWFFQTQTQPGIMLNASIEPAADISIDQIADDVETVEVDLPEVADTVLEEWSDAEATSEVESATADVPLPPMVNTAETTPSPSNLTPSPVATPHLLAGGGGLQGRDANARARLAATRGGSAASEAAVEAGLAWIVEHQRGNGSWRLRHDRRTCNCRDPGTTESTTAATGLALMSLLGAGYTHETGPYQKEVRDGLDYLRKKMRHLKFGGSLSEGPSGMYSHAIATTALAEAVAMTGDRRYKKTVQEAQRYIVSAQHPAGGWRYIPQQPGDILATTWQIMALKACKQAGVETDPEVLEKAGEFIDSMSLSGKAFYRYQKREPESATSTATGLLMQMYLGWDRSHPAIDVGSLYVLESAPSDNDVYLNYYASLLLHHAQSDEWKAFNRKVRDHLVATQSTKGHEAGSWFFPDRHGNSGGRLYTTAMAIMTLEVYYRFLPLYDLEIGAVKSGDPFSDPGAGAINYSQPTQP